MNAHVAHLNEQVMLQTISPRHIYVNGSCYICMDVSCRVYVYANALVPHLNEQVMLHICE